MIFKYTLPIAILVAFSQILIKCRSMSILIYDKEDHLWDKVILYFSDWYILAAYFMALIGSFIWLLIIPKVSPSIAFPVYIGTTFLLIMIGSLLFLGESFSLLKLFAIFLILAGIFLGGIN